MSFFPVATTEDHIYSATRDSIFGSDMSSFLGASLGSNLQSLLLGYFSGSFMSPVRFHVSSIFKRRCPSQVVGRAAAFMTISTTMRGLMLRSWSGAVKALTDLASDELHFAINHEHPITFGFGIRPKQALLFRISKYRFFKETSRFTPLRESPILKVWPPSPPTMVVHGAQSPATDYSITIGHGAFHDSQIPAELMKTLACTSNKVKMR